MDLSGCVVSHVQTKANATERQQCPLYRQSATDPTFPMGNGVLRDLH